MSTRAIHQPGQADLRLRARARLTGRYDPAAEPVSASAALGVLHELASSPDTASDALALLHELQVHQVELELQAEELRNTRADLEAELRRQRQLHDHAPAALFTLDADTLIHEINLTGARLLGAEREALAGRPLTSYLTPRSAHVLQAMVERVAGGSRAEAGALEVAGPAGTSHVVQARVSADPAGGRVLVALLDLRSQP